LKTVGKLIRAPLKALGVIKTPSSRTASVQRTVTRDDARDSANLQDELRRRRGGAADLLSGTGGAEAAGGSTGSSALG